MISRLPILVCSALVLVVGACSSPSESATESASVATSSEPVASVSASALQSATESASAGAADCIDQQQFDLLVDNVEDFEGIPAEQRQQLADALTAYDFSDNETAATWRDDMVEALESGVFDEGLGGRTAFLLTSGALDLETCD